MAYSRGFYVTLVLSLLGDAFCIPAGERLPGNHIDQEDDIQAWLAGYGENKPRDLEPANSDVRVARDDGKPMTAGDSDEGESRVQPTTARPEYATPVNDDDDDDDDDFDTMNTAPSSGGGSNILSLLRLATALFPSSSGGANEDGSDLGTLLATISGIVANLSGDGFDLNALIGSGIGLFVGLLSEGEENPGAVIASYLLTSLETITGGGSQAKTPSGEPASPVWTLKMDILRALLQFGTSILGQASSSSSGASTG